MDKTRELMLETLRGISAPSSSSPTSRISSSTGDEAQRPLLADPPASASYSATAGANGAKAKSDAENGDGRKAAEQVEEEVEAEAEAESIYPNGEGEGAASTSNGAAGKRAKRVGKGKLCIA
jgi:hypothetical protein